MSEEMTLETRPASKADEPYIWRLYGEAARLLMDSHIKGGWDDKKEKKQFLKHLKLETCHMLFLDGAPVGWAAGTESPGEFTLEHLYIDTKERGKGLGGTFFIEYSAMLKQKGVTVYVEIMKGTRAREFVEKNGFVFNTDNGLTETLRMT